MANVVKAPTVAGTSGEGADWTSPGNVFASDDLRATSSLTSPLTPTSKSLDMASFGFAIPGGATIDGIEVRIERSRGGLEVKDSSVKVASTSANRADAATNWPTTDAQVLYGSPTDLWGLTWTAADVNASGFGAFLVATTTTSGTAQVDYVSITVYYTELPFPDTQQSSSRPLPVRARFAQTFFEPTVAEVDPYVTINDLRWEPKPDAFRTTGSLRLALNRSRFAQDFVDPTAAQVMADAPILPVPHYQAPHFARPINWDPRRYGAHGQRGGDPWESDPTQTIAMMSTPPPNNYVPPQPLAEPWAYRRRLPVREGGTNLRIYPETEDADAEQGWLHAWQYREIVRKPVREGATVLLPLPIPQEVPQRAWEQPFAFPLPRRLGRGNRDQAILPPLLDSGDVRAWLAEIAAPKQQRRFRTGGSDLPFPPYLDSGDLRAWMMEPQLPRRLPIRRALAPDFADPTAFVVMSTGTPATELIWGQPASEPWTFRIRRPIREGATILGRIRPENEDIDSVMAWRDQTVIFPVRLPLRRLNVQHNMVEKFDYAFEVLDWTQPLSFQPRRIPRQTWAPSHVDPTAAVSMWFGVPPTEMIWHPAASEPWAFRVRRPIREGATNLERLPDQEAIDGGAWRQPDAKAARQLLRRLDVQLAMVEKFDQALEFIDWGQPLSPLPRRILRLTGAHAYAEPTPQTILGIGSPPVVELTQTFTTTGTFTWPDDVTTATFHLYAGGGGGATGAALLGGGGGGGAAYSTSVLNKVTPTDSFTIGAGGGAGIAGGDSWFRTSTTILAKGGAGGSGQTGGTGGLAASGFGTTRVSGGTGGTSTGSTVGGGGGGGGGGTTGAGSNGSGNSGVTGGAGGAGGGGQAGAGGAGGNNAVNGTAGVNYGGAGGGSGTGATGASGTGGVLVVVYSQPVGSIWSQSASEPWRFRLRAPVRAGETIIGRIFPENEDIESGLGWRDATAIFPGRRPRPVWVQNDRWPEPVQPEFIFTVLADRPRPRPNYARLSIDHTDPTLQMILGVGIPPVDSIWSQPLAEPWRFRQRRPVMEGETRLGRIYPDHEDIDSVMAWRQADATILGWRSRPPWIRRHLVPSDQANSLPLSALAFEAAAYWIGQEQQPVRRARLLPVYDFGLQPVVIIDPPLLWLHPDQLPTRHARPRPDIPGAESQDMFVWTLNSDVLLPVYVQWGQRSRTVPGRPAQSGETALYLETLDGSIIAAVIRDTITRQRAVKSALSQLGWQAEPPWYSSGATITVVGPYYVIAGQLYVAGAVTGMVVTE